MNLFILISQYGLVIAASIILGKATSPSIGCVVCLLGMAWMLNNARDYKE